VVADLELRPRDDVRNKSEMASWIDLERAVARSLGLSIRKLAWA
jgi:hypothetical protein